MKYKVFFLVILGVFVLWSTTNLAEAAPPSIIEPTIDECIELDCNVVGNSCCCGAGDEEACYCLAEGDRDPKGPSCEGPDEFPEPDEFPKKEDPRVLKPRPLTEQPPEKRYPNVLTPRPMTDEPKKGITRQPAQKVR